MTDARTRPFLPVPRPLLDWLGLERMLVVQSGTCALSAGVRALARRQGRSPGTVRVPALACWTLTTAVRQSGAEPRYDDINADLGSIPPVRQTGDEPAITVAPWNGRLSQSTGIGPRTIFDGSVGLFSSLPTGSGALDVAVISLGSGKPLHTPGGGGLLLFNDPAVANSLLHDLAHGRSDLAWLSDGPRLLSHMIDHERFSVDLSALADSADERREAQELALIRLGAHCPTLRSALVSRPGSGGGVSSVLPVLLDDDFPLNARDVHRVMAAHGLPLAVQPVTPPYLEPAVRGTTDDCPTAEAIARRLLFVPATPLPTPLLEEIAHLLQALAADPELYRHPYGLIPARTPPPITARGPVTLGRRIDGSFAAIDDLTGRVFTIPVEAATRLLGRAEPRTSS